MDRQSSAPQAQRESDAPEGGTAPPPSDQAAGVKDSAEKKEATTPAKEEETQSGRQESATTSTAKDLGLRPVPKASQSASSHREASVGAEDKGPKEDSALLEEKGTQRTSGREKRGHSEVERKKEKKHKTKRKSRSPGRKRHRGVKESEEGQERNQSPVRLTEREVEERSATAQASSPKDTRGDQGDQGRDKETTEGSEEIRERSRARTSEKPPEPAYPPRFRYQEEAAAGGQWHGPIRAPGGDHREEGAPSKGSKKRETQRNFKEYRKEHGSGRGFYRPWDR